MASSNDTVKVVGLIQKPPLNWLAEFWVSMHDLRPAKPMLHNGRLTYHHLNCTEPCSIYQLQCLTRAAAVYLQRYRIFEDSFRLDTLAASRLRLCF